MRRVRDADDADPTEADDRDQQYEMYRKTLRALEDVTPDDDDEGIAVVADWIIERLETGDGRPSSKAVRQRAQKYCRQNGYEVSNNDWMGR